MPDIKQKIALAREFGSLIQAAFSVSQFREMVDRNKAEPEDSGVCHTHDYCDSNMVMLEAFQNVFKREPDMDSDDDLELWNDAWAIAFAADFFA